MDTQFRMLFLFQDQYKSFVKEFSDRKDRMLQFLSEVEACAVQLDEMNKGAKISGVVGSSVGVISGVLSIIGFALIPVTAGASVALIATGAGLGAASGANSIVTTATEIGVNHTQKKKATETLGKFMEDVNVLQDRLNEVIYHHFHNIQENPVVQSLRMTGTGVAVIKSIDTVVDCASAIKVLATEGRTLGNVSRAASEIPELGQAAVKGPLAMSKAARGGLIAVNALFIGVDVFTIVNNSIDLSKGCETKVSGFLRARAALWRSEIDSWQKMVDSLENSQQDLEKKQEILRTPFY